MTQSMFNSWFASVAVIISMSSFILSVFEKETIKKHKIIVILSILIVFISIGIFLYSYDFKPEGIEKTESELLKEAEDFYFTEQYEEVLKLYFDKKLATNPVALNNLGYMYEHGIAVKKDFEKAKNYYRKSANLKYYDALENYEIFTIRYPSTYKDLLKVLEFGYQQDSMIVNNFVKKNYRFVESLNDIDYVSKFFELPDYEQEEILDRNAYEIECEEYEINSDFSRNDFYWGKEPWWGTKDVVIGTLNKAQEDGSFISQPVTAKQQVLNYRYVQKKLYYDIELETRFININEEQ